MPESNPLHRHRIRLQGPWEWAVPTPVPSLAWTWNRIRLPDEWDRLPHLDGEAWFRRRFQAPTGLTPADRLWIVLHSLQSPDKVILNGIKLIPDVEADSSGIIRYDITSTLEQRNLIEIAFTDGIQPTDPQRGIVQSVVLEIESNSDCPAQTTTV